MNAFELVLPIEEQPGKLALQHFLIINDSMVIKHWREEWAYESTSLLHFKGNKTWVKMMVPEPDRAGAWTQSIWEVNDEPRYQGSGRWITNNGKTYWENTTDAPLPRREYTTRNDYTILRRTNKLVITTEGYIHEQDNEKIARAEDGTDQVIALEKGYNTYRRIEAAECTIAMDYWTKNNVFWASVRKNWEQQLMNATKVEVKATAKGKTLNSHFSELKKDWSANKITTSELDGKVKEVIAMFLQTI